MLGSFLVLLSCGGRRAVDDSRQSGEALVELAVEGGRPPVRSGFRILPTGEYQIGEATLGGGPPSWRTIWVYPSDELAAVRKALDSADDPPLPEETGSAEGVHDGGTARWLLRTTGRVATVTIKGYPAARVARLDRLYAELQQLHVWPQGGSVWRVAGKSGTVVRTARCDALTLPSLQDLISALYPAGQNDAPGEPVADDLEPALIDVTWYADGRVVDRLRVLPDGRRHGLRDGALRALPNFTSSALQTVRAAVAKTGFESLADPLC